MRRLSPLLLLGAGVGLAAGCATKGNGDEGIPMRARPSVDDLAGQPIWSESVALDYLSDDGSVGFAARLCLYPDREAAWLWLFVFDGERTLAFVDNHLGAPPARHDALDEEISYDLGERQPTTRASFSRGASEGAFHGVVRLAALLHDSADPQEGPGDLPLELEARFDADHEAEAPTSGRREVFGHVSTNLALGEGDSRAWSGSGKWHEQHQEQPRWTVPFSYLAVQQMPPAGDGDTSLLAVTSPAGTYGFLRRAGGVRRVVAFDIEPPTDVRHFRLELDDSASHTSLEGGAERLRRFSVPIYSARREGSHVQVRLDDRLLLGALNDWTAEWE